MFETILTSDRWESNACHVCPAPRHHGQHSIINFYWIICNIRRDRPHRTNHEFIPKPWIRTAREKDQEYLGPSEDRKIWRDKWGQKKWRATEICWWTDKLSLLNRHLVYFWRFRLYRSGLAAKTSFEALYIIFEALFVLYYSYVENCLIS